MRRAAAFFSWTAAIALVLAAVYAHPPLIVGVIVGAAIFFFAPMIDGAGIGILYVAVYAAWLPLPVRFAGLLGVTVLAVWRPSKQIAIVGMLGGFVTAYLLSTPANYPLDVFTFLFAITAGLAWLAAKRAWWEYLAIATVFVAIYEWSWTLMALDVATFAIAAAIFAVFGVLATVPLWSVGAPAPGRASSRWIAAAAAHLPLIFALYAAANPNYAPQYNILFTFLLVVDAGLMAIVWRSGPKWLHAAGGIATLLTFIIWFRVSYTHAAWPWILAWAVAFIALYLVKVTPFAGILFAVFIGLGIHEPEQWPAMVLVMFLTLGAVFVVAVKYGRPLVAALAIALSCVALMTVHPPLYTLIALHAILFAELFVVAWISARPLLAILAVPFLVAMVATAYSPEAWGQLPGWTLLAIAAIPYLLFIAYAFFTRATESILPYVAAAIASLFLFILSWPDYAGIVALVITLLMGALLWRTYRNDPREPRTTLLLTLTLAFSDVAAALLLPRPLTVIYFALGVAFLAWLFGRLPHPALPLWAAGLAVVVFGWLAFDASLYVRWWVYVACGLSMFAAAWLLRVAIPQLQYAFSIAGLFELWFLINIVIANWFHSANGALSFDFAASRPAETVTYTLAWSIIATALLIAGYLIHWPAARAAALALLVASVAKTFLFDLFNLHGTALALSLLGLGASVAVVGVVLQRWGRGGSAPSTSYA